MDIKLSLFNIYIYIQYLMKANVLNTLELLAMAITASAALILAIVLTLTYLFLKSVSNKNMKKMMRLAPPEAPGGWPIIGHYRLLTSGPQPPHITLGKIADEIGPIFTIKIGVQRALVVNNWELAKQCFTTNDIAFANRPKTMAIDILCYNYAMFGFSPYGDYWRQLRKVVTLQLLSNHKIEKRVKHVIEGEVKAAIDSIKDKKNNLDLERWVRDITMNVILRIVVGKRCGEYCDEGEEQEWRTAIRNFFILNGKFAIGDAVPWLRWMDIGGDEREMKNTAKVIDSVMNEWLQQHKTPKQQYEDEDFMDVILSILQHDPQLATSTSRDVDTVAKSTCLALIFGGSETIAKTLVSAFCLLLNNSHVQQKAQDEIDNVVGRERVVKESDLKNLVYLNAIIKETFRLCPPAPLSASRESIEDCTVGGYHIPSGTQLFVNVSKIHKDPRVWNNPWEFQPERFLTLNKDIDVRGQDFELLPFGSGRRICPGISFSMQVLNLMLASVLQAFEIQTTSGEAVDVIDNGGLSNSKPTPIHVMLTPRLPP